MPEPQLPLVGKMVPNIEDEGLLVRGNGENIEGALGQLCLNVDDVRVVRVLRCLLLVVVL